MPRNLAVIAAVFALALAARPSSAVHFSFSSDVDISIDGDRIVLAPHGEPKAEIAPSGDLRIDGRLIAVPLKDRLLLARYNQSVQAIVAQAVSLGVQGASLGVQAITAALVGLATGDKHAAERTVEPRAERMKERGRALCLEARTLRLVQDEIAADVPAFRPYALIEGDNDRHNCHIED